MEEELLEPSFAERMQAQFARWVFSIKCDCKKQASDFACESRKWQHFMDQSTVYLKTRWIFFLFIFSVYSYRVYYLHGWYIVSYGLGIYILNLTIGFLSPQVCWIVNSGVGERDLSAAACAFINFRLTRKQKDQCFQQATRRSSGHLVAVYQSSSFGMVHPKQSWLRLVWPSFMCLMYQSSGLYCYCILSCWCLCRWK